MHEVALAILWHQHQPYYPDDFSGENPMPWVRLHAAKDYWGMAALLKETPEMRLTINLVPSLLKQLHAYAEEGRTDDHLRISRLPADGLSENDMRYLMDNFFMVNADRMIRPFPRYYELYKKRGLSIDSADQAAKRFTKRDVLDLQCWSNLAWIHPLAFEQDADLAGFLKKGGGWTEQEKQWLLDKQMKLLREVIPLHKELQDRGQVELTTTPFYHPILPLLIDKKLARRAMPHCGLPKHLDGYAEDAREHLKRAVAYHEKLFGQKPHGMWPSEGSVCQAMIPSVAETGVQWIASDEEILSGSTDGWVSRDGQGFLRHPEALYQPWRVEEGGKQLQMIFRDHAMSDLIGFQYQRFGAEEAVSDFIGKLEAIGAATANRGDRRPTLVSVILDGENCWEYYPEAGVEFLRSLYRRLAKHPHIRPTKVSDYLTKHPATEKIGHLFPGSWIQHNFGIWIGHPECNDAWDRLFETRKHLAAAAAATKGKKSPDKLAKAWEELFIAEGSDWFWWFGDSHECAQKDLFDRLFRAHLQNVYRALDETPPAELAKPISRLVKPTRMFAEPTDLLDVTVDGRETYFEWINAGRCIFGGGRGTMSMVTEGIAAEFRYGFNDEAFFLRIDANGGAVRERFAELDAIKIKFAHPEGFLITVKKPSQKRPTVQLHRKDVLVSEAGIEAASDIIFELAAPLKSLTLKPEHAVEFHIELVRQRQTVERLPHEGTLDTAVPSRDFALMRQQE